MIRDLSTAEGPRSMNFLSSDINIAAEWCPSPEPYNAFDSTMLQHISTAITFLLRNITARNE